MLVVARGRQVVNDKEMIMSLLYSEPHPALAHRDTRHPRPSLWRCFLNALEASRRRHAEREIARFLEAQGGRFNDRMERAIEARVTGRTQKFCCD